MNGDDFETRLRETGQQSLFPTEDLIIPESLIYMRKAVAAIHATPIKAEHSQSLNSRRLFDALILVAQIDFRKRGKDALERVKRERLSPLFETRITDLAKIAGIPGKNYQRLYEELETLFEMVFRWNVIGEGKDIEWEMKSHFLSSLGIGKNNKRGLIRYAFDPSVLEILLEPSNWATLSMQAKEDMRTAASYALWQNVFRYVNTNAKVTAALPTSTWVELILGPSSYVEEVPNEGKRVVRYADFKRRVLVDAIRRVNDCQALNYTIELKEFKSGSRVVKLQFKFVPKAATLGLPLTWPEDVIGVLERLGHSEKEIEDIGQTRSYEEVAEALVRLKQAEAKLAASGKKIGSKKAYFNGILSNIAMGASIEELDDERLEQEAASQEAQRLAQLRMERLQEQFQQHLASRFSESFFELENHVREDLIAAFMQSSYAAGVQALLKKRGWESQNRPALAVLRKWLSDTRPADYMSLLPMPQDSHFDSWMAWRLEGGS